MTLPIHPLTRGHASVCQSTPSGSMTDPFRQATCARAHIRTHAHTHVHTHAHTRTHTHARTRTHTHARTHAHTHTRHHPQRLMLARAMTADSSKHTSRVGEIDDTPHTAAHLPSFCDRISATKQRTLYTHLLQHALGHVARTAHPNRARANHVVAKMNELLGPTHGLPKKKTRVIASSGAAPVVCKL
jgi:hypothetical protein